MWFAIEMEHRTNLTITWLLTCFPIIQIKVLFNVFLQQTSRYYEILWIDPSQTKFSYLHRHFYLQYDPEVLFDIQFFNTINRFVILQAAKCIYVPLLICRYAKICSLRYHRCYLHPLTISLGHFTCLKSIWIIHFVIFVIKSTHYEFLVVNAEAHMAISWHVQGVVTYQSLNIFKID